MSPHPRAHAALVAIALVLAPAGGAQRVTSDPFAPGTRVSVWWRDAYQQSLRTAGPSHQVLRGTVLRATRDTLVLDLRPGIAAVPRAGISGMAVSRGIAPPLERAIGGALFGGVFGGLLGAVAAINDRGGWEWDTVGDWAAWGAGGGFVLGLVARSERWRRVPRSVIVAPASGGGASLGGRAAF